MARPDYAIPGYDILLLFYEIAPGEYQSADGSNYRIKKTADGKYIAALGDKWTERHYSVSEAQAACERHVNDRG